MRKEVIFSLPGVYRDDFRVTGYRFGQGEKTCCIIGSLRGNEIQQLYMCGQLVKLLTEVEKSGNIAPGKEILVIPSLNNYGTNIGRRNWCLDNTDINRMFPGDPEGDTTRRIAAGVMKKITGYKYGVQFSSFYIPGVFIPHVRMLRTGLEITELAELFGLRYAVLRTPAGQDRTTLNYHWQKAGTAAFSVYTGSTEIIKDEAAQIGVSAVMRFLTRTEVIEYEKSIGVKSTVVSEEDMLSLKSPAAGIYREIRSVGDEVKKGEVLAQAVHPYEGTVEGEITAPEDGVIFFAHKKPLVIGDSLTFKMIKRDK